MLASIMPSVGIIDEVNFAISHQIIWRYRPFFVSLHPKHQEQYPKGWLANRVLGKPRWSRYDVEETFINFKNIPSYATTHLLHQVCPVVCRHADSRVSNSIQSSGRQYRLDWYACLPRPCSHRRVPTSRHWCLSHIWRQVHLFRTFCQIWLTRQQVNCHRVILYKVLFPYRLLLAGVELLFGSH